MDEPLQVIVKRLEEGTRTLIEQQNQAARVLETFGMGHAVSVAAICECLITRGLIDRSELAQWLMAGAQLLAERHPQDDAAQKAVSHIIHMVTRQDIKRAH